MSDIEHKGLEGEQKPEFESGEVYAALVEGFAGRGRLARINVLRTSSFCRWLVCVGPEADPTKLVDYSYIKRVTQALKLGDVIWVSKSSKSELSKDRHGWTEASDDVPKRNVFRLYQEPIAQAALMSVDNTGYVVAQVSGYDFETSSFNRAIWLHAASPEDAFKPIVYSAAIDKLDYTAGTLLTIKPLVFGDCH